MSNVDARSLRLAKVNGFPQPTLLNRSTMYAPAPKRTVADLRVLPSLAMELARIQTCETLQAATTPRMSMIPKMRSVDLPKMPR